MKDGQIIRSSHAEIDQLQEEGRIPDERASVVASGYETTCPGCDADNHLIEVPAEDDLVECGSCHFRFLTDQPDHAYQ